MQFIISFVLILVMLSEKIFFLNLEPQYFRSFWGIAEIVSFGLVFIFGIYSFISEEGFKIPKRTYIFKNKPNFLTFIFLGATVLTVFLSFVLNFSKVSVNWDAIALYDARAKFLSSGMKFSEMTSLAKFDNLNKYYYLLYPPYTSIAHFFWEKTSFLSNIPVGVYYSLCLFILVAFVFLYSLEIFGITVAAILSFLVASNSSIFNIATKEYTNMPYSLYLTVGIFLIFSYLRKNNLWKLFFGVILVASSIWIRYLEPMWFVVGISLVLSMVSKNKLLNKIFPAVFLLALCLIEYLSWGYFVSNIGHSPSIVAFSAISILEPIAGVFTGAWFPVFIFFVKSWGIPLLVSILALISGSLYWKKLKVDSGFLFFALIIMFSIILYFMQLYYVSFQADWWMAAAQSLDRSSTFLVPISGFLLVYLTVNSKMFTSKSDDPKNIKKSKKK